MKKNLAKEYKGTVTVIKDNQLLENFPFIDEKEIFGHGEIRIWWF